LEGVGRVDMVVMVVMVEMVIVELVVQALTVLVVVVVGSPLEVPKITVGVAQDYMDKARMVRVVVQTRMVGVVRGEEMVFMVVMVESTVLVLGDVKMIQIVLVHMVLEGVQESFGELVERILPRIRRMYKYKNLIQ